MLWIIVNAEFLALILVLVYVGAVMTLFLFVVMMLNIDIESMKSHFMKYLPFGLILVALLVSLLIFSIPKGMFISSVQPLPSSTASLNQENISVLSDTQALGMVLYTDYVFAFELAAVILLVAIIAAITLVHRSPMRCKQQDIVNQIKTRREDRVVLKQMSAEKA